MLYQTPLAIVMFGIGTCVATTVALVPVGIFFTGIGLMILHAFGFVSPPF
jgi:hypothetical protein